MYYESILLFENKVINISRQLMQLVSAKDNLTVIRIPYGHLYRQFLSRLMKEEPRT